MKKETFLLITLFLFINSLAGMAANMKIDQSCWFLYTPEEKWHGGNILNVTPLFANELFRVKMNLKELQLADSRGSKNDKIEIDKILFSFDIGEKRELEIGDLDLHFSPFTLGRTAREKRVYQLGDIRGTKISGFDFFGASTIFYIGKEGETKSYGSKISKSFSGVELNGIYVGNLLEANTRKDIAWTIDFSKHIGNSFVISGLYGEHSAYEIGERRAPKVVYNTSYFLKLSPNTELTLFNWKYEQGFNPYFRDRTPQDPDFPEIAGNILDQWGGTTGSSVLLRTENTFGAMEKIGIEKYLDAEGLLQQKSIIEVGRRIVASDFIFSYEEKVKQIDKLSNLNHITNTVKIDARKGLEADKFLLTGGARVGFLLNSKKINEQQLYLKVVCRNSLFKGLELVSQFWEIMDFKRVNMFSLEYSTPGGTKFFIKDRKTTPCVEGDLGLRNPKQTIDDKLIESFLYVGIEKSF